MNLTTNILLTTAGFFLLILVFYDIFATILRATRYPGPISQLINRGLWWIFSNLTRNLDRRSRHRILSMVGPLLMPILIIVFVSTLVTGFALIYLPQIETDFIISKHEPNSPVFQSFYFSGVTFLTIGYGDVLPSTTWTRVLAIAEGACGIAILSLSITYLLTVYGALERKRTLALSFYHQARQGADVAGFISAHFSRGRFHSLTETLRDATRDLQELLESHLEHPIINYFHPLEVYKGLPRALFVVLETVAILNAHVDEREYVEAGDHPDVIIAGDNARYVLAELVTSLALENAATEPFESEEVVLKRQKNSFNRALRHLKSGKIQTRTDIEQAFGEYREDRAAWESQLYHFADFLGYDWDEVTGDRNLEDATDDEIAERHEVLITDIEEKKHQQKS
ncbi:MAG TPA: potassium channel family protein [Pyrinomonadaceae bacterium]|jgi:hypothetical protein